MLRKWMMERDTLGYSGKRGSKNLGELTSDDYPTFCTLIWHEKIKGFTLLLLTSSKTMLFKLGAWGLVYVVSICGDHSRLSST